MSHTHNLASGYRSFLKTAGTFAFYPYTKTFEIASEAVGHSCFQPLKGALTCAVLTIIPVLPTFTALTCALALAALLIAGIAALFAFPIAAVLDNCQRYTPIA